MDFIPVTEAEMQQMLTSLGVEGVEELFADIPGSVRLDRDLDLPPGMSESAVLKHMRAMAGENQDLTKVISFLGGGIYEHLIPAAVGQLLNRGEFFTAYTPYQAEISQGFLQAIFEYQTMICELTGMEVANASMYDGPTALAEAAIMACGIRRRKRVVALSTVHPEYIQVVRTYLSSRDLELQVVGP